MTHFRKGAAFLAIFALAAPALADSVTCESDNGRERYCPMDTRGGVSLSTQLSSRGGCYQGDTWGYDQRGVWVSGGCRAIFQSGGYSGYNYHSSNDYYSGNDHSSRNDGAAAAVAIGAILGAALIASAASKSKNQSSGSGYQQSYNAGCTAARNDRRDGRNMGYSGHGGSYNNSSEQAFASGYNACRSGGR